MDLSSDKWGVDPPGADDVRGNSSLGELECECLGKSNYCMLAAHVGSLMNGGNNTVDTGDIDNSTPVSLFHMRDSVFADVPVTAIIEVDDLLELFVGEVFYSGDILHSGIVNDNIYGTQLFNGIVDKLFAEFFLGQVQRKIDRSDLVSGLNFFLDIMNLLSISHPIKDNIRSGACQNSGDS